MARRLVGASAVLAEVSVDQAVPSPAPGRWPAAAFDGAQYLVAWEDLRARRPILYGGRVAADGSALDALGFPLLDAVQADEYSREYQPAVAAGGGGFLVVTQVSGQIHGVRASAAGDVLDAGGFAISAATSPISQPSLAFDGDQFLVAWSQGTSPASADNGIYLARVKPDGTVLDPGGVRAFSLELASTLVGVSFDGTNHLLSWADIDVETQAPIVYAARIAPDGTPIDASPIRVNATSVGLSSRLGPVAGFDGTNHVIAWALFGQDEDGYDLYRILASRVTKQGEVLDPDGIVAGG
ncbi:MAG TPA: hypothetical protein VNM90_23145, partial [Haliangium sp.]|nr:hypothetical protein [Haliangium sp.]